MLDLKVLELADLVLQLNDEPDLGRRAEVADNKKADHFKEAFSGKALIVPSNLREFFKF